MNWWVSPWPNVCRSTIWCLQQQGKLPKHWDPPPGQWQEPGLCTVYEEGKRCVSWWSYSTWYALPCHWAFDDRTSSVNSVMFICVWRKTALVGVTGTQKCRPQTGSGWLQGFGHRNNLNIATCHCVDTMSSNQLTLFIFWHFVTMCVFFVNMSL